MPADRRLDPKPSASTHAPSGFFALRTPLLPFDVLTRWTREHLRNWVEDAMVREALFLASPSLEESLPVWLEAPDSERGRKVERTLVRYFARMAGRSTPFGLFATHAVGQVEGQTRLRLGERSGVRKHTRLDMDYVCALTEKLRRAPEVRQSLRYEPNSSLFRTPTHLRYLETRQRGQARAYNLVAVETAPYLERTLERARGGATLTTLAEALLEDVAGTARHEALDYVEALAESQVLVPTWAPTVTGPEPIPHLLTQARDIPALAPVRERLAGVQARLLELNHQPGAPPEAYRDLARQLEPLPVPVSLPRLFQVDALRPGPELSLSRRVTDGILAGVEALRRLTPRSSDGDLLARFRERFAERYESRAVPLLEALDEERGLGLKSEARIGTSTSPLLRTLPFGQQGGKEGARVDRRARLLLRRVEECWRAQAPELVLTEEDLASLEAEESAVLPDGFGVMGTLVARSAEAVDAGDFRFVLEHAHGPSGAVLLGRFCHDDPSLEAHVREHLAAEERLRPDAIFAEIVHLPQDRMGNVICRPALRQHDIVFLGQSGLPEEQRIRVEDLWLSLENGRLVLRSRRLGREVIPRMSNAHAYGTQGVGVYRFLGMLQNQDQRGFGFHWGALGSAAFLPRVSYGRTVLSLARWNLRRAQLQQWRSLKGEERLAAFAQWRQSARLPRWVCLKEGDNVLPLDLDNPLCLEMLLHSLKGRDSALLEELYPGPDELCVESGDGRYVHELVVPFIREARPRPMREERPRPTPSGPAPRRFPPGSEWLYLKLYTGTATADRLLREALPDTVRRLLATGATDRWFFLRYADPEHHLRLRFHGDPARLESEVWPALRQACAAALDDGSVWRLQLDTYEREVERYGGPEGILLAEELFSADSDAVLTLLQDSAGDEGADQRWRLALQGMATLLEDLGLTLEARLAVAQRLRENFAREFSLDPAFEERLGLRFRAERKALETLLLGPGPAALRPRSARVGAVGPRLWEARREARLSQSVESLAGDLLHMHANRMLPGEQRAQELVLYDFLERLYRSRLARERVG
ncbi:MAG: lantibiotic dehydratase [Cystobacter sp.]